MATRILVLASVSVFVCAQASGAGIWTAGSTLGTTDWNDGGNWDDGLVPSAGSDVEFAQAGSTANLNVAATVGTLTFNAANDFTLATTLNRTLTLNGNVIVNPLTSHNYQIDPVLAFTAASATLDVGDGSLLNLTARFNQQSLDVVKTGSGLLRFSTVNTAQQQFMHSLDIQQGAVDIAGGGNFLVRGPMSLAAGTTLTSIKQVSLGVDMAGGDSLFLGPVTLSYVNLQMSGGTLTIRDGGQLSCAALNAAGAADGTIILDETGVMLPGANRLAATLGYYRFGNLTVLGNSGTVSGESFAGALDKTGYRNAAFTIRHGSTTAAANTYVAFSGAIYSAGQQNSSMITAYAQDSAGNYEELGTPADLANYAASAKSYFFSGSGDASFVGSGTIAGAKVLECGRAGAYVAADGTMVGSEFLTLVGTTVYRYDGTARKDDINVVLPDARQVAVSNFELTTAQSLISSRTVNSLKLTNNMGLDLGGNVLCIGGYNNTSGTSYATPNMGGGIIITGTSNAGGGISNGILATKVNAGNGNCIFLTNDVDFELRSTATVIAKGIAKSGTAKLTLSGPLLFQSSTNTTSMNFISWFDGSIEYKSPTSGVNVNGVATGPGQFILDNSQATVTFNALRNWTTGGVLVKAGTLQLNGTNWDVTATGNVNNLGAGVTEVFGGAVLYGINANIVSEVQLDDGATLRGYGDYRGRSLRSGSVINVPTGQATLMYRVEDWANYNANPTSTQYVYGLKGAGTLMRTGLDCFSVTEFTSESGAAASTFSGNILIQDGEVRIRDGSHVPASLGTIYMNPGTQIAITADTTVVGHTYQGFGRFIADNDDLSWQLAGTTNSGAPLANPRTLTIDGGSLKPGNDTTCAQMSVVGNLNLAGTNGYATLYVRVKNGQGVAGSSFDQLALSGTTGAGVLGGLANGDLNVTITAKKNYLGAVITIITTQNDLTGQYGHDVTFNNTGFADIAVGGTMGAGWVTLSNISYPGDANRDGITDMSDYIIWFNNFGQT
ncbi:MAG: beta strand repeat-containing protein, partial [Phycisphaerae bacterium]